MTYNAMKGGGLDLQIHHVQGWARETFPGQTKETVMKHMMEEIGELEYMVLAEEHEDDVANEMADVLMTLAVLADLYRIPLGTALAKKFEINRHRTWEFDERLGYHKHVTQGG